MEPLGSLLHLILLALSFWFPIPGALVWMTYVIALETMIWRGSRIRSPLQTLDQLCSEPEAQIVRAWDDSRLDVFDQYAHPILYRAAVRLYRNLLRQVLLASFLMVAMLLWQGHWVLAICVVPLFGVCSSLMYKIYPQWGLRQDSSNSESAEIADAIDEMAEELAQARMDRIISKLKP